MKRLTQKTAALLLALVLAMSLNVLAFASNYADMPEDWSRPALESAVDNGLLLGDGGLLNPGEKLTRAELAAVLTRAFGPSVGADLSGYADVPASAWYFGEMAMALHMGVLTGSGSALDPERPVTRQEAFAALANVLDLEPGEAADLEGFEDADSVSGWAVGAVAAMVNAGYIGGNGSELAPERPITRAEFAQVLYDTFAFYIRDAGQVTEVPEGNVIVSVSGVTLKDVTVTGDLIIGDGVDSGDFHMDNVKVEGAVIVRGGGENSVYFKDSLIDLIKVTKPFDGAAPLRLVFEGSTSTTVRVEVSSLNCNVILEGTVGTVTIKGEFAFVTISGKVTNLFVTGGGATIQNNGTISNLNAGKDTTVNGDGKITIIGGDGKVTDENGKPVTPPAPYIPIYYPPDPPSYSTEPSVNEDSTPPTQPTVEEIEQGGGNQDENNKDGQEITNPDDSEP